MYVYVCQVPVVRQLSVVTQYSEISDGDGDGEWVMTR